MATIVPAILEKTRQDFEARARSFERLPDALRIQVDFADGKFVSNTTVSIGELDALSPVFTWEAHLMVAEPVDFFDYQMAGFSVLIVHYEAFGSTEQLESSLGSIRKLGLKVGLAFNPETSVEQVAQYAALVDQYTILSIHPGTQGQEFLPESYNRIKTLRALLPEALIEVDGGVNQETARRAVQSGANLLAVGSALWEDPVRSFEDLESSLQI
ncbi:MAG: ribulose-phosphate 3-epimerase [Candidatus Doudnabacteria bacterium]|nr:ribulose-phosphate 3-epimerase [Candidatus Doudnabacteria bacterium]